MTDELLDRVAEAHGGRDRWAGVRRVMATLSMGGTEFLAHMQPRPFQDVEITLDLPEFRASMAPFPQPGLIGIFEQRRVRVENDNGRVVEDRAAPGAVTRSMRHWVAWDSLDLLYVAGVLLWHSLVLPRLLIRSGVGAERLTASSGGQERIEVHFPADVPVPSARQTLHIDGRGLVRRVDYAPGAYGGMIRVGQIMERHESCQGLVIPAQHDVYPSLPGGQLWRPTRLAWLTVDDITVSGAGDAGQTVGLR